jgi:hypothetical protein
MTVHPFLMQAVNRPNTHIPIVTIFIGSPFAAYWLLLICVVLLKGPKSALNVSFITINS